MTMNDKQWSLFRKIRTIYEYYNVSPYKTYNSRPIGFFSSSQSQGVSGPLGSDIHVAERIWNPWLGKTVFSFFIFSEMLINLGGILSHNFVNLW